ncbi:hypothetical protein TNCV_2121151 [Trichonephila clavipes]|nr:hypothetical protein TNCV_2121151 [Trichonephila clavipes]
MGGQTSKFQSQCFWNSHWRVEFLQKRSAKVPAPGGVTGPINCGVRQQDFSRFRKFNGPYDVTLHWSLDNQRQLSGQDKDFEIERQRDTDRADPSARESK